jgi:hypothetical protein
MHTRYLLITHYYEGFFHDPFHFDFLYNVDKVYTINFHWLWSSIQVNYIDINLLIIVICCSVRSFLNYLVPLYKPQNPVVCPSNQIRTIYCTKI